MSMWHTENLILQTLHSFHNQVLYQQYICCKNLFITSSQMLTHLISWLSWFAFLPTRRVAVFQRTSASAVALQSPLKGYPELGIVKCTSQAPAIVHLGRLYCFSFHLFFNYLITSRAQVTLFSQSTLVSCQNISRIATAAAATEKEWTEESGQ